MRDDSQITDDQITDLLLRAVERMDDRVEIWLDAYRKATATLERVAKYDPDPRIRAEAAAALSDRTKERKLYELAMGLLKRDYPTEWLRLQLNGGK